MQCVDYGMGSSVNVSGQCSVLWHKFWGPDKAAKQHEPDENSVLTRVRAGTGYELLMQLCSFYNQLHMKAKMYLLLDYKWRFIWFHFIKNLILINFAFISKGNYWLYLSAASQCRISCHAMVYDNSSSLEALKKKMQC